MPEMQSTVGSVIAVLSELKKRTRQSDFPADEPRLHAAFLQIRNKYPELLPGLTFDNRGLYPHSEELENILNATQLSGSLERSNPTGTRYRVTERGETIGKGILNSRALPAKTKQHLVSAAMILRKELAKASRRRSR
jgi:hypothetical protein